jgi:hypothetical protein
MIKAKEKFDDIQGKIEEFYEENKIDINSIGHNENLSDDFIKRHLNEDTAIYFVGNKNISKDLLEYIITNYKHKLSFTSLYKCRNLSFDLLQKSGIDYFEVLTYFIYYVINITKSEEKRLEMLKTIPNYGMFNLDSCIMNVDNIDVEMLKFCNNIDKYILATNLTNCENIEFIEYFINTYGIDDIIRYSLLQNIHLPESLIKKYNLIDLKNLNNMKIYRYAWSNNCNLSKEYMIEIAKACDFDFYSYVLLNPCFDDDYFKNIVNTMSSSNNEALNTLFKKLINVFINNNNLSLDFVKSLMHLTNESIYNDFTNYIKKYINS